MLCSLLYCKCDIISDIANDLSSIFLCMISKIKPCTRSQNICQVAKRILLATWCQLRAPIQSTPRERWMTCNTTWRLQWRLQWRHQTSPNSSDCSDSNTPWKGRSKAAEFVAGVGRYRSGASSFAGTETVNCCKTLLQSLSSIRQSGQSGQEFAKGFAGPWVKLLQLRSQPCSNDGSFGFKKEENSFVELVQAENDTDVKTVKPVKHHEAPDSVILDIQSSGAQAFEEIRAACNLTEAVKAKWHLRNKMQQVACVLKHAETLKTNAKQWIAWTVFFFCSQISQCTALLKSMPFGQSLQEKLHSGKAKPEFT